MMRRYETHPENGLATMQGRFSVLGTPFEMMRDRFPASGVTPHQRKPDFRTSDMSLQ